MWTTEISPRYFNEFWFVLKSNLVYRFLALWFNYFVEKGFSYLLVMVRNEKYPYKSDHLF